MNEVLRVLRVLGQSRKGKAHLNELGTNLFLLPLLINNFV